MHPTSFFNKSSLQINNKFTQKSNLQHNLREQTHLFRFHVKYDYIITNHCILDSQYGNKKPFQFIPSKSLPYIIQLMQSKSLYHNNLALPKLEINPYDLSQAKLLTCIGNLVLVRIFAWDKLLIIRIFPWNKLLTSITNPIVCYTCEKPCEIERDIFSTPIYVADIILGDFFVKLLWWCNEQLHWMLHWFSMLNVYFHI